MMRLRDFKEIFVEKVRVTHPLGVWSMLRRVIWAMWPTLNHV